MRLRASFGWDAELYDRVRPNYPEQVFADLASLAHLSPGDRVLEIGCGTGQATVPLAEAGYEVLAVELSPGLGAVASGKLAQYPNARVVVSAFEEWKPPAELFDAVVSATAFHWLDPEVRLAKSAHVLRPGGTLAVIETHQVADGSAFFEAAEPCYEQWVGERPAPFRIPTAEEIPDDWDEIAESPDFRPFDLRRYLWEATYATREYIDLLSTYSDHISLEATARQALYACLAELIAGSYGGSVTKRYLTLLRLAQSDD
jgi:SAM-dependent methyltransferase